MVWWHNIRFARARPWAQSPPSVSSLTYFQDAPQTRWIRARRRPSEGRRGLSRGEPSDATWHVATTARIGTAGHFRSFTAEARAAVWAFAHACCMTGARGSVLTPDRRGFGPTQTIRPGNKRRHLLTIWLAGIWCIRGDMAVGANHRAGCHRVRAWQLSTHAKDTRPPGGPS